jgi:maltooligosyltrehalose trehalohydrolase
MQDHTPSQGAWPDEHGVRYSVWAPSSTKVEARIYTQGGAEARTVPLVREENGYFRGTDPCGQAGDLYKISIDGSDPLPPPAARFLPQGVNGPAEVTSAHGFAWTDHAWRRPALRDLVIYELHLGTFTPEGTYRAAMEKLPYLHELGINAIEIMPVADFPGERGWGYDGVQLFAPARCYGKPDDFRALIDAAHRVGVAVILDVVYNHFGPDGNYLPRFSPHYFAAEDRTPWGSAINFGHDQSRPVRDFFRANVFYWMEEFHIDGFRLDATHAIIDHSEKHFLRELADLVQARGGYIIAEDERNEAKLVTPVADGGFGLNAVWADDFHHIVEVAVLDASVYRKDFQGDLLELQRALEQGWHYSGQVQERKKKPRGTPCGHLAPESFIFCISNHDQVGNRALGERLHHLVSPETYRAASALLLLNPYTPLLFMGQEWAASSPFQYFTDHHGELGRKVEEGRRREFKEAFAHLSEVPSPQDRATFERSKLRWEELSKSPHASVLALYRELLRLRREHAAFRPRLRETFRVAILTSEVLVLRLESPGEAWLLLCDLRGGHAGDLAEEVARPPGSEGWQWVFSSNEERFGGDGGPSWEPAAGRFNFTKPEVLLLHADTSGP